MAASRSHATGPDLVSVVTACYNAGGTIGRAIESVLAQTYPFIEYIVIDGGSSDDTLRVVNEMGSAMPKLKVVSEPDRGISDAFNKGIALATGNYVQLLNADDYLPPTKIADSVQLMQENPHADFAFGDLMLVDHRGVPFIEIEGNANYARTVNRSMPRVNHPTFFVRESVYRLYGGFEERWSFAMDYDWLLRVTKAGVRGVYSPKIHAQMQAGGASWRNPIRCMNEERLISVSHGRGRVSAAMYFLMRVAKLWTRLAFERVFPSRVVALLRPGKRVVGAATSRTA
ncbi:MAG: glycosyltransferase [Gemmatimonadetes bacterium]|nr:glycosyltransferase [Gemmatimonadota bacterium]